MVSRRNYVTIVLMIVILLFMFMFTGVLKQELNEYNVNDYEDSYTYGLNATNMYRLDRADNSEFELPRRYAVFIEPSFIQDMRDVVTYWCTYTKRGLQEYESFEEYVIPEEELPEVVIIDGRYIDVDRDLPAMQELTRKGVHLIFAKMPHITTMTASPEFCEFLGIRSMRNREVLVEGVHLFDGFLLGGERIYATDMNDTVEQDLEMVVHWYVLDGGTKTYIMGMMDEDEYLSLIHI